MSNDPHSITLAALADLLRGLGLNPVDLDNIKAVHITPGRVEVVRTRRDPGTGGLVPTGVGEVATETVTIAVVDD